MVGAKAAGRHGWQWKWSRISPARGASRSDSKNTHIVMLHPASRKIVSVDSCFLSCLQHVHTFTKIKGTKMSPHRPSWSSLGVRGRAPPTCDERLCWTPADACIKRASGKSGVIWGTRKNLSPDDDAPLVALRSIPEVLFNHHILMMSLRHGWGWYPPQTPSYIHIRHIQSVWAFGMLSQGHVGAPLYRYTGQVGTRFGDSRFTWGVAMMP